MPRKGTSMSKEAKDHLSKLHRTRRRKAEKYARYLGLPIDEVMHNLKYLEKNFTFRQIQSLTHYNAQKIIMEGDWKKQYKAEDLVKANNEQQSDYVKSLIRQELLEEQNQVHKEAKEKFKKEKALNCGYKYEKMKEEVKEVGYNYQNKPIVNSNDPSQDLKVAFWFINKMGGIEKASKIFAAAKLAIEAMNV